MFACFDLIGVNYEIQSLTGKTLCLIKILLWLNITQGKNLTQPSINDFKFTKKLPYKYCNSVCFVNCGFMVHCYQTSLLTTLLPDNKNCVQILKGSYIVMKCSDNKVYETI